MTKHQLVSLAPCGLPGTLALGALALGALALGAAIEPATAQTTVWSEAPKTEVWSEPPGAGPGAPRPAAKPRPAPQGGQPQGGQVDPRLIGVWDVRIPTGVTYHQQGQRTYQRITPGANFNRLTIRANGAYQWGAQKGTLKEVRPYFIAEGQRYFEVAKDRRNTYLIRYNERDKSLAMFFTVGGFVAKGTRVAASAAAKSSRPAPKTPRRK
jgi:hypothetical protein